MAGRPLTIKQEKFVQGLFAGLSQREAYKQAFNCNKMTDKTIDENASRLANSSKVVASLDELKNELRERNMVSVERTLQELAKIAHADIKDFLSFGTEMTEIGWNNTENIPILGYKQVVEVKPSDEVDGSLISEVSISKDGTFKFKLHDKMAALDKIGKHLGMFTDKMELTGKDGGPIETATLTPEERQARINELIAKRGT